MFLINPSVSSISESFLTVKGAALFLPRGNGSSTSTASRFSQLRNKHAGKEYIIEDNFFFLIHADLTCVFIIITPGDIQQHLQTMFILLRPEDNIKLVGTLMQASTLRFNLEAVVKELRVFFLL